MQYTINTLKVANIKYLKVFYLQYIPSNMKSNDSL